MKKPGSSLVMRARARAQGRVYGHEQHRMTAPQRNSILWLWQGTVLGIALGALCALLLLAPARWLAQGIASASNQQVLLQEARGTVWDGSARVVLSGGEGSQDATALPERVQWSLRPAWSGLRVGLQAPCCTSKPLRLSAQPRWSGLRLEVGDALSRWPASVLTGLGTPWNTVQAEGTLQLQSTAFSLQWNAGRLQVGGGAVIEAQGISSKLSTLRPMGSYRVRLNGGDTASVALETIEGSLQLSGSGQWVGSRLRFTGEASAAPDREAALANLLNIIGRRNGPRSIIQIG